ncbi:MAG TPA: GAF domain-containing protein [Ktedonobacteraceae bacterium]|nr:GAF domain-containing protein [Ktedonobacteraceae bacterium]
MDDRTFAEDQDALREARITIANQQAEIEQLRLQLASESFAKELRTALIRAATADTIASPVTHSQLLEMIVATAAHILSAQAASLFLIDNHTQELIFEVALGQKAEEVKKFRIPLGHGIAGLVAVSGQPMAVSHAESDLRQASDVAQAIGYVPRTILCAPLIYSNRITGVLELLDKTGDSSFNIDDMNVLSMFANQAAVAIEQSRMHESLLPLIVETLQATGGITAYSREELQQLSLDFITTIEQSSVYHNAMEFARLIHEISWQGDEELKMCYVILSGFADYLRSRTKTTSELGWL